MAKTKFYAVQKGRKPGVYLTWADCQEQTKGFSGAKFKGFSTHEEAQSFVDNIDAKINYNDILSVPHKGLRMFTDGSFDAKTGVYGGGVVVIDDKNQVIETATVNGNNEQLAKSRNVTGEVIAAMKAIDIAIERKLVHLTIIHDYEGIEKWATNEWQTSSLIAIMYDMALEKASNHNISLHFIWVKGHTGVAFNEMADKLAKQATKEPIKENKMAY